MPVGQKHWKCVLIAVLVVENFVAGDELRLQGQRPCTCLSAKGEPVDWFFVYKAPSQDKKESVAPYLYMDSESVKLRLAPILIDDAATPFARTLVNSVYHEGATDLAYVMYNDEAPPSPTAKPTNSSHSSRGKLPTFLDAESHGRLHGHTKGVLVSDEKTGFWLTHSVPKFPPRASDAYGYPSTAMRYAQHILCLSFSMENVDVIAEQLQFNYPKIYDSNSPEHLHAALPAFQTLLRNKGDEDPKGYRVAELTTLGGEPLTNFAKNDRFNASLYSDLLAPHLRSDFQVESWQNGKGGKEEPNCGPQTKYHVENIASIDFRVAHGDLELRFPSTKDHAKWAIAVGDPRWHQNDGHDQFKPRVRTHEIKDVQVPREPWTCIGDVNRMESQFVRGGGTTCFSNAEVWHQLHSLIASVDACPIDQS